MSVKYVLLIDDESDIRELLKDFISVQYPTVRVIEAIDGMDALRKIANQKFNLIICDLKMPKADGMEVIKSLSAKNKDNKPDAIMVLSGTLSKEQTEKLNKSSPVHFMGKPYDEAELKIHLDKILSD